MFQRTPIFCKSKKRKILILPINYSIASFLFLFLEYINFKIFLKEFFYKIFFIIRTYFFVFFLKIKLIFFFFNFLNETNYLIPFPDPNFQTGFSH